MLCYLSNQIFYFLSGDGMGKIDEFLETSGNAIKTAQNGVDYLEKVHNQINGIHEYVQDRAKKLNSGEWDAEKQKCAVWDAKAEKMKKRYMIFWVLILIATIVLLFVI